MNGHQLGLWILNPDNYSSFRGPRVGAPSDKALLLRQVASEIMKLVDLPLCGEVNLEEEVEGPAVILTLLPNSIVPQHPAADDLIQSEGVRLLLSRPSFTVLFVYPLSRETLNESLRDWIWLGPHQLLSGEPKYKNLAVRGPLSWSFVTVEEILTADALLVERLEALKLSARFSAYDPTGIRSFVHLAVSSLRFDGSAESMPPLAALVVDDEKEPCERFAYLVRRLGFSPVLVGNERLWNCVKREDAQGDSTFDLAVVDDFLGFNDRPRPIGHNWLRQSSIRHKWFKTANSDQERERFSVNNEYLVSARPADPQELVEEYLNSLCRPRVLAGSPFFDFCNNERDSSRDSHFHEVLIQIGRSLAEMGSRLEQGGQTRQSALHYLEAFLLLRGRECNAAAEAFSRFQEIEVRELLDGPPRKFHERWPVRQKEIIDGLCQAFAGSGEKGRDGGEEREHWTLKTYQAIARAARAQGMPPSVLQDIEAAILNVRAEDLRKRKKWISWRLLTAWIALGRYSNSLSQVAGAWGIMVIVFAVIYGTWESHIGQPWSWVISGKAALASLVGGLGLMYPDAFGLGLPKLAQVSLGLVQRIFSLLLFARMVSLFIGRVRGDI